MGMEGLASMDWGPNPRRGIADLGSEGRDGHGRVAAAAADDDENDGDENALGVFKKSMFQKSVMKSQQAIKNSTCKFGTTHRKFLPSFSPSRPPHEAVKRRKAAFEVERLTASDSAKPTF